VRKNSESLSKVRYSFRNNMYPIFLFAVEETILP